MNVVTEDVEKSTIMIKHIQGIITCSVIFIALNGLMAS